MSDFTENISYPNGDAAFWKFTITFLRRPLILAHKVLECKIEEERVLKNKLCIDLLSKI